jgi:hypothetical protein
VKPLCTCQPGSRCTNCAHISRATARLITYHSRAGHTTNNRATTNPIIWADTQTGIHDCRIALCITMGYPLDQIEPSLGHAPSDAESEG